MALPQPKPERLPDSEIDRHTGRRLFVVLEEAFLETVKAGRGYALLSGEDHGHILRKQKRNAADARPDIVHRSLLALLDSPLNKAGLLQVYIHTQKNQLIEVNPEIRLPRTTRRFGGLIVQLLYKQSVRAAGAEDRLLRLIRNPVEIHLPPTAPKIGTSASAEPTVDLQEYVNALPDDSPVVFVIGAQAHGRIDVPYVDTEICISDYHLSASAVCARLTAAFERKWNV